MEVDSFPLLFGLCKPRNRHILMCVNFLLTMKVCVCVLPVAKFSVLSNINQNDCLMTKDPYWLVFSLGNEPCIIISNHQGIRRKANLHVVLPLFKQFSVPLGL